MTGLVPLDHRLARISIPTPIPIPMPLLMPMRIPIRIRIPVLIATVIIIFFHTYSSQDQDSYPN